MRSGRRNKGTFADLDQTASWQAQAAWKGSTKTDGIPGFFRRKDDASGNLTPDLLQILTRRSRRPPHVFSPSRPAYLQCITASMHRFIAAANFALSSASSRVGLAVSAAASCSIACVVTLTSATSAVLEPVVVVVVASSGAASEPVVVIVVGCECLSADANAIGAGGPSDFWARAVVVVAAAAAYAFASASLTFALCSNPHGSDPGVRFSPAAAASARSFSICFIQKASTSSLVLWCSVPSS